GFFLRRGSGGAGVVIRSITVAILGRVPATVHVNSGFARPEQIFYAGKEAHGLRMVGIRRCLAELLEKLALPAGKILRHLDIKLQIKIAEFLASQNRHALALDAELFPRLGAFGDFDGLAPAGHGRYLDLPAERGIAHRDRDAAIKIRAIAL